MTILKLCERSFKWDLAGYPSSIRLEMALEWRQVVKNLEIHYATFMGYLYSNIKTKRIELRNFYWRHLKKDWSSLICSWISYSAQEQQIWKIVLHEILNLSLNAKFCISKNMALFLYVFTTGSCFSKCKFMHSETD